MGNNHNRYFGSEHRKILILGLESAGKTSKHRFIVALVETLSSGKFPMGVPVTRDMNIRDKKMDRLQVTFFDLAGGERQRVFWRQHYIGCQGVVFLIDASTPQYIDISLQELEKSLESCTDCPFAICLSKKDIAKESDVKTLISKVEQVTVPHKENVRIFSISSKDINSLNDMAKWLLGKTSPL